MELETEVKRVSAPLGGLIRSERLNLAAAGGAVLLIGLDPPDLPDPPDPSESPDPAGLPQDLRDPADPRDVRDLRQADRPGTHAAVIDVICAI